MKKKILSVWFNGKFVEENNVLIPFFTPTGGYGLNIFENVRGYWNSKRKCLYMFRLDEHISRLMNSCLLCGINLDESAADLESIVHKVVKKNNISSDVVVKISVVCLEDKSWSNAGAGTLVVSLLLKPRRVLDRDPGLSACVSSWARPSDNVLPPRVKIGANYICSRYGHLEASRNGYDLPIFLNNSGKVAESGGANIFIVRHNTLITPELTHSVLEGVTRDSILKIANALNIKVKERSIDRTELYIADEIFLCGTSVEIVPIKSVDNIPVAKGSGSRFTETLLNEYHRIAVNESELFPEWRASVAYSIDKKA